MKVFRRKAEPAGSKSQPTPRREYFTSPTIDGRDVLTSLYDRDVIIGRLESGEGISGVVFIGLDNFKAVNDILGLPTGDLLLRSIAVELLAALPVEPEAVVGRVGGDQFIILVADGQQPVDIETRARIVVGRERVVTTRGSSGTVSLTLATFGISSAYLGEGERADLYRIAQERSLTQKQEAGTAARVAQVRRHIWSDLGDSQR